MSTRGCIGFRINEVDKVMYNHCDSYPRGLGEEVLEFIATTPIKELKAIAKKIQLVEAYDKNGDDTIIDPAHLSKFKRYADPSVGESMSNKEVHTYYQLLRNTQGDLGAYKGDLDIMIDNKEFLYSGLYCEYAYIINIDTEMLEFYVGFRKNKVKGRYNLPPEKRHFVGNDSRGYNGVSLMMQIPLKEINESTVSNWVAKMKQKER